MKNVMKLIRENWKRIIFGVFIALLIICFFDNIGFYLFGEKNYRGELIKVVLTLGTGITSFLTWYGSYKKNTKIIQEQTNQHLQITETNNEYVHFNNIIGHLGDNNLIVVLEGINALHEMAVNNKNYTKRVHNLFCTYIRENSSKLYENIDLKKTPDKSHVIIQTLIDYLFKPYNNKESIYKEYESNLSYSTLKNCNFCRIDIKNVNFSSCLIENCDFYEMGTSLTNCKFNGVKLTKCYFGGGNLTECNFLGGILTECDFLAATLTNCIFVDKLVDGKFNTKMYACKFEETKLINTELPPQESGTEPLPNNGNTELQP